MSAADNDDDDDDEHSINSVASDDSTLQSIQFKSIRDDNASIKMSAADNDDDDEHSINSVASDDSTLQSIQFKSIRDDNASIKMSAADNDDDDDDDDEHSINSVASDDSTLQSIQFKSIRDDNALEQGISFIWPTDPLSRTISLSTLLEPDDLAPLFAGAQWAGTRVWHAAIHGMHYMERTYLSKQINKGGASLLELGCGLGVPGMVWHMLGGSAVLTDQESIMSQLHGNLESNFPDTTTLAVKEGGEVDGGTIAKAMISAHPLSWSREKVRRLLTDSGYPNGFDFVLNCDCVYEPLYGKSWELLVDVIDELLRINPRTIVVSSVERRSADGIDSFVERMKSSKHVDSVDQVLRDDKLRLEIYVTKGIVEQ